MFEDSSFTGPRSQGDEAQGAEGGISSLPAVDTERRGNKRLTLSSQTPAEQSPQVPVNSNTLNVFKRELEIAGTIADNGNKDKLSFCGLIRQINSAVSRGYSETEIIEAVIKTINPGICFEVIWSQYNCQTSTWQS